MSRQNKVNPGQYTQRGRLAQDDVGERIDAPARINGVAQRWVA